MVLGEFLPWSCYSLLARLGTVIGGLALSLVTLHCTVYPSTIDAGSWEGISCERCTANGLTFLLEAGFEDFDLAARLEIAINGVHRGLRRTPLSPRLIPREHRRQCSYEGRLRLCCLRYVVWKTLLEELRSTLDKIRVRHQLRQQILRRLGMGLNRRARNLTPPLQLNRKRLPTMEDIRPRRKAPHRQRLLHRLRRRLQQHSTTPPP